MNEDQPHCPKCNYEYTYKDSQLWICSECFYEWSIKKNTNDDVVKTYRDSVGNILKDGDSIITIRDLKAGKNTIKAGTKAKNIQLLEEPVNGHEISCKVPGHGHIYFTCKVVKKA